MGKLICTSNTPFPLEDWADLNPKKIVAGMNCIMVLTEEGEAFQKISRPGLAIREDYWYDLKDIALSKSCEGAAIGLMNDGTCMISKRFLRTFLREQNCRDTDFHHINDTVKSWRNIVQVACSDAFFALDAEGRVHYMSFCRGTDGYYETRFWENVAKIVPGPTQHAIFGITREGRVLCAGRNCTQGPQGGIRGKLAKFENVADIAASGAEGSRVYLVLRDGTLVDPEGRVLRRDCAVQGRCLEGHYWLPAVRLATGSLAPIDWSCTGFLPEISGWAHVQDFALGNQEWDPPFALALTD